METNEQLFTDKCCFCQSPSRVNAAKISIYQVECARCGIFSISSLAAKILSGRGLSETQCANISGFIRENQGVLIKENDLDFLVSLRTPSVAEKAVKLMRRVARTYPSAGESFMINYWGLQTVLPKIEKNTASHYASGPESSAFVEQCRDILPWLATAWAKNWVEMGFIIQDYLRESTGLLGGGRADGWLTITPKGWSFIDDLAISNSSSSTAFVAMWFDESMHQAWIEAIGPAIEDAGYKAVRIDKIEHNNRIDDEIIAAIRSCNFLVADFTGQRGGVYFEAGFAQGLGKQVIWLCREDELGKVHFDTRQYNHIKWQPDDLSQLRSALRNRIEATIGKGNLRK